MKGGARTRSGPAPDPNALRRDRDAKDWLHLPVEGRAGEAPAFPLDRPSQRELDLWAKEWIRPQAVVWEANHQEVEVAIYVRSLVDAESPTATTAARTLVKQQMEALGLSIPGLRANRWIIGDAPAAKQALKATGTEGPSAKDRLKVLDGGGA